MEKISYEKPRTERRQVNVRCGMLAGSAYSPEKSLSRLQVSTSSMTFEEGGDYAFDGTSSNNSGGFKTSWEEE